MRTQLGKFVTRRLRSDGTYRVLFEIPARLRPAGWRATNPLPLTGTRTGDLADEDEVRRIRADAAGLYADYRATREGKHKIAALVRRWQDSQEWKDNRPITNKGYLHSAGIILRWAKSIGNPAVENMSVSDVEAFLGVYDDRPTQRYHLRKALRLVMKQAVRAKWRPDNPVDEVRVKMPKTSVAIWTRDDVSQHVQAAVDAGEPSLAALILTLWEIGQRLTDVIDFRHGHEYFAEAGVFRFHQSKTAQRVTVPISHPLRATIEACRQDGSVYLFNDSATGRPYLNVDRLWHVFDACRPKRGRRLVLRALRHTCVLEMARAGASVPQIVSITGHKLGSATAVLQTYLPRDSEMATQVQRMRGFIEPDSDRDVSG